MRAPDHARFVATGLDAYEPFEFSRHAPRPDGGETTVSFVIAFLAEPGAPEAAFFVCQHKSAESLWAPAFQRHANTAAAIAEVTMVAERPLDMAGFFADLLGPDAVTAASAEVSVSTSRGAIRVLSAARFSQRYPEATPAEAPFSPYFVACRIAVADIAAAGALVAKRKLRFREREGALFIDPRETLGVSIELAPETPA